MLQLGILLHEIDEIVYFSVRWKTRKFSLPHLNQELKLVSRIETENGHISRGSESGVSMVTGERSVMERIYRKGVSFEFRLKECWMWSSDEKW